MNSFKQCQSTTNFLDVDNLILSTEEPYNDTVYSSNDTYIYGGESQKGYLQLQYLFSLPNQF